MKDKIKVTLGIILIVAVAGLLFKAFFLYRYDMAVIQGFDGPNYMMVSNVHFFKINRITGNVLLWSKTETRWALFKSMAN